MDYDDSDFQSQNLQLAGEGSNKFPPVLSPYALPKFDFDDNLHGPLRFDSLVETEVFLGIESNEDSQWIEDFSRGSGGIQFSSSAAESCSIPLRHNVWSEATSSESVEMLLKSVGQEELILTRTRTKESDACDELGCMIKHMEPDLKQTSNITSRVEDITNLQFPGKSGIDDDNGIRLSEIEDISHSGGNASGNQGLGDLTTLSAEVKSPVDGRRPFIDRCDGNGTNEMNVDSAVNEFVDYRMQESFASETEVDNVVVTVQNSIQGNDGMDNKDASDRVIETGDEELDISGRNKDEDHEKGGVTEGAEMHVHVPNAEINESGASHLENACLSPIKSLKEKSAAEANLCSIGEPCVLPKEDSGVEICRQSSVDKHEASLLVTEVDFSEHRHVVEDSNGTHLDKDRVTEAVSSILSIGDNKGSEAKVDGKLSSYGAVNPSSSELCGKTNSEDHIPSSMMVEDMQMCEKDVSGQQDVTDIDVYVPTEPKKGIELSSFSADVNKTKNGTSSFGEGSKGELMVSKSESDSIVAHESANVVIVASGNGINKDTVCEKKVEVSPLSPFLTCSDTGKENAAKSSAEVRLSDVKATCEALTGADSGSEKGSAVAAEHMLGKSDNQFAFDACDAGIQIESHSVAIGKVGVENKEATSPLCASAADMRESVEKQMKGKRDDEKEHVNVSDTTAVVVMPGPVPSTMMESLQDIGLKFQKAEVVIPPEDARAEQITLPSTNVEQEGSADLDKPASGSPTVIRSAQSSYDERNKEGTKLIANHSGSVPADKVHSASMHLNKTDPSKDDGSFSFDVSPPTISPRKNPKKRHASSVETSKATQIVDASASSRLGQSDPMVARDLSHGTPKVSDLAVVLSGSKSNTERKPRRASGKAPAKESAKKRNSARETASAKSGRGEKMTGVSLSESHVSQHRQSNEIPCLGNLDSNIVKPIVFATSTAGLPDLNSSVSQAAIFHQPFTDLQQVQLRAQIFVYGALIQGTAPDEAYMTSAFGGPDGGRSMWENSWRSCIESFHGHKSHLIAPESPLQSRSGARPPESSIKHSAVQSKLVSSPIGRGSSMGTPAIVSPILPFSSPLWTMPTPAAILQPSSMPRGPVVDYQRPLSPLHAHQTPAIRNFVGHSPSWLSQAPYGTPWVASPQNSTLDTSGRFSVQLPVTETVQPTPVKDTTSVHLSSTMKPTGHPVQNAGSTSVFAGSSPMLSTKMVTASGTQPSTDLKPRKRKKNSTSENIVQNVFPSQTESVIASVVCSSLPTSVSFAAPVGIVPKGLAEKLVTSATPMSADFWKVAQTSEQQAILSDETIGKVKDAKALAEDAAASAASAVSHSQQVWDGLAKRNNVGLLPDAETKLASAAVAIAAAAAVAKAAAAAAKVASNAAFQAKLMAEEAVASASLSQINVVSTPDGMKNVSKATPASILKSDDGTNGSSSIIVAAKEAARKKVEAASAATRQAENMDAIVKAAEIAAEAVSQAGIIVAMGDPMPLNELVVAGPKGYWKSVTPEHIPRSSDADRENRNINSAKENTLLRQLKEVPLEKKDNLIASQEKTPAPRERLSWDQERLIEGITGSGIITTKDARVQRGRKASNLAKAIGVVPESENASRSSIIPNETEKEETLKENNIKEHSLVEVYKDGNGFKAAWFPAKVMSLKDEKAYVEYTELVLGEGSEKLKEWVPLEGNGDQAPKIRIARPTNIIPFEGTRKRRRAAMVDHVWSIGDRVDAWIEDSWREGIVTEKNKRDESLLTVNFPARGEILVIPATLLHPSCVWKDGAWVEWSSSGENGRPSHGGDSPKEKRRRVRSPVAEAKGKDKAEASGDAVESDKSNDPTLLALSAGEKLFNVGKSSRDEHRTETVRMPRTGLQKQGSRVIFGVPKPGKKRKFMDVSKHYVADRSGQTSETKDSLKFTKYLVPQGPGSRAWKRSTSETNEKRAAISKPKNLKSGKQQNVLGGSVSQKDDLSNVAVSVADSSAIAKDSVNQAEEKQNAVVFQPYSASGGAGEGPILFSARAPKSDGVSSKRMPSTNPKPQRVSKGRLAPASARLQKMDEGKTSNGYPGSSTSDSVEPRRSNRRIQPTSRLLEGIQSSLMVSKIPFVLHEKSHKSKNVSRGNNQG